MRLSDGTETVTATVPEELGLEIEFEVEDGDASPELELTWLGPGDEESTYSVSRDPAEERDELSASVESANASQSLARFEVFRDRGEEWRWRLRHRNGNIIATSGQGYTHKHNA